MPAPGRKSSIGSSRTVKKYIPYRADDFQHGKKTGIAVAYVDHRSDEFEPFEKVMSQADLRTPPRVQNPRKKRTPKPKTPIIEEYDDEDGEMSMELEESNPRSPAAYFANTRINSITSSAQRVGSSTRPVAHSSDVDFDKVPSPRASPSSSRRRSLAFGISPRPSRLSQSAIADYGLPQPDDMNYDDGGQNYGGFDSDDDDDFAAPAYPSPPQRNGLQSRRTSFTQIDQEGEDDEEGVDAMAHESPNSKAKGKQRIAQPPPHGDSEMEDGIAGDFNDVDQYPNNNEEEETVRKRSARDRGDDDSIEKQPASKKVRKENAGQQPRAPRKRKNDIVLREVTPDDPNTNPDGLRRGRRTRYKPLDWWRNEKVVYGRRETGTSLVPTIKEIHRIPKEEPQPLGGKHRKKRPPRSKSKTFDPDHPVVYNPEEGWDDDTPQEGTVLDYVTGNEVVQKLAYTANMVKPKPAINNQFFFQKIFGDGQFIAAGQLVIPPHKQKPTKGTKDNTFVFYVIEGAVNFRIHRTSFVLTTGGMFLVPRGNMYYIQNISDRDAKLFFAQARKVTVEELDEPERDGSRKPEERSSTPTVVG